MGEGDIRLLRPKVQRLAEQLVERCDKEGLPIIITRTLRTTDAQDELYARGRTQSGTIVTNARGGSSYHNYGVAFDVRPATFTDEKNKLSQLEKVGAIGTDIGLEWGGAWGEFPDAPHFQYTAGFSIEDFKNESIKTELFE